MIRRINIFCDKYPYISQGIVSATLQLAGDVVAQKYIEKKESIDTQRGMNFFGIGFVTGVVLRSWYGFLEKSFQNPKAFVNAVSKVAANQFLFRYNNFLLLKKYNSAPL